MRFAFAIAMATLTVVVGSRAMLAQVRNNVPALESIRMIDALIGWAVTHERDAGLGSPSNALVRTADGATQWKDVTPNFGSRQNRFNLNGTNVDVFTSHFAWVGPFRTIDGGRTWNRIRVPEVIRSIHFINARDGWLLSYQGARVASLETGVYRSVDGGEAWAKVASSRNGAMDKSDLPDVSFGDPHITFVNAMIGWITQGNPLPVRGRPAPVSEWANPYVTHDGGQRWRRQTLSLPPQIRSSWVATQTPKFFTPQEGILPTFYADHDPRTYRATSPFVVIYVTYDGGSTWRYTTPVSVVQWGPLSFADVNHGWLVNGETLYATSDGGRHWAAMRPASFADIRQLNFISPRVGWAVRQRPPFLLKTQDGGRTWTPVTYVISK